MASGVTENENAVSQAEFARRLGVSRATVSEYKKNGWLVFSSPGLVDVKASVVEIEKSKDASRGGKRAKKPAAGNGAFNQAKAKEMQMRADKAELELLEKQGSLVSRDRVELAAFTLARAAQEGLMSIPDRLSSLLAAESDPAVIHKMISDEIRSVSNTLADSAEGMLE